MIGIKELVQVAPFPQESKKQLLDALPSFSDEKKFELMQTCWQLISADYQNKLSFEIQKMTLEMAEGTKSYTQDDFKKAEDDLFNEIITKLEAVGSEDKIEEIRQQLKTSAQTQ